MKLHTQPYKVLFFLSVIVFACARDSFPAQEEDLLRFPQCRHCRMHRSHYAQSRMLIEYSDGAESGLCSIHCLAVDLVLNTDKTPKQMMAADYVTRRLIDAESAFWVLGGAKRGVMTQRAKWAFDSVKNAESFIGTHGGAKVSFEQALAAAFHDMYADSKIIRSKRKLKMMIDEFEKRAPAAHGTRGIEP